MNEQFIQPSQNNDPWFIVLIVLLIAALIGGGIFAYQYFKLRQEFKKQAEQMQDLLSQKDRMCVKKLTPATSPAGECEDFPTACDVPLDYEITEEYDSCVSMRDARRISDFRQIQLVVEIYFDQNQSYPASISDISSFAKNQGFMPELPLDPLTKQNYYYTQISSGNNYHLGAKLENIHSSALKFDSDYSSLDVGGFDGQDPVYDMILD